MNTKPIQFTLNGQKTSYSGNPELSLLKYLREEKNLMAIKDACSSKGTCGCCTVNIDHLAVLSCRIQMHDVDGKSVVTPEGLTQHVQKSFGEAFVEEGGVQCGYCTPGIVMTANALIHQHPDPTKEQITEALQPHLCRCTGYKKVVKSIDSAAKKIKKVSHHSKSHHDGKVGTNLPKYKGEDLTVGKQLFVGDIREPGMLYGALRFSDHPRAKVLKIDAKAALGIKGVHSVFTAKDVPGDRHIGLIVQDWPLMISEGEVTRYVGDVIAGVVADNEDLAREAAKAIQIEYEVMQPLTDPHQAMDPKAPLLHPTTNPTGNVLSVSEIKLGNFDEALKKSDFIVNRKFTTQRIEHAFMETECCLAKPWKTPSGHDGLFAFSQSQGVYEDRKQIAKLLGLAQENVNVQQVQAGGGFGGKEDLSVQGHAALMAWLMKKPVRVALNREESMIMHPKRHPFEMEYTLGCDKNGKFTVLIATMYSDSGAYASVGMKVNERAVTHSAGGYSVPNLHVVGYNVYTNNVPCGAMRGFGVNQAAFAMEACIDELCEKGKFDRWQIRWDNALREGEKTCSGQTLKGGVGIRKCLEALKPHYDKAKFSGIAVGIKNTGIGCGMPDIGRCKVQIHSPTRVTIHHGWTEMGQGVHTMAIQSLCELTGINPEYVEVHTETKNETLCGMTTSSRGTSLIGLSLIEASKKLKEDLKTHKLADLVGKEYFGEWTCDWTTKVGKSHPDPVTHYSYGYAAQLVELDDTGKIKKIYAAHDAGRIMNPHLFEGQIEGALHMGLGYAISENFPMENGKPKSTLLAKMGILRAKDMPEVEVIGIEVKDTVGPFGVKGVGEIGLVPTAAAIANALYQFDHTRRTSLPLGVMSLIGKGKK